MLEGGEDPRFIARRMVILASEDIGNADPQALVIATAAAQAVDRVGLPECALNLAQAAAYLALAPKSNAATKAISRASAHVREHGAGEPPPYLQDAHYPGAKQLGRGVGYRYAARRARGRLRPAAGARIRAWRALLRARRTAASSRSCASAWSACGSCSAAARIDLRLSARPAANCRNLGGKAVFFGTSDAPELMVRRSQRVKAGEWTTGPEARGLLPAPLFSAAVESAATQATEREESGDGGEQVAASERRDEVQAEQRQRRAAPIQRQGEEVSVRQGPARPTSSSPSTPRPASWSAPSRRSRPRQVQGVVDDVAEVQPFWAQLSLEDRSRYMRRAVDVLLEELDELAELLSTEQGKPRVESYTMELLPTVDALKWIADEGPDILSDEKLSMPQAFLKTKKAKFAYEPYGVVGVIAPWNYPWSIPFGEVAIALMAGNGVVLKPASLTPLIGERIRMLFEKAGFPEGIVRTVHGGGRIGDALVKSTAGKIFFTGSVEVGRKVGVECAKRMKGSVLELGGKDPQIVCADADLANAVSGAVWGGFANAGQTCSGIERIYVHEDVADEFLEGVVRETKRLTVGDPMQWDIEIGPMISDEQADIVMELVDDATKNGAKKLTGGRKKVKGMKGSFIAPIVLTGVTHEMRIMKEEIFGPVLPIMTVSSEEEAIELANDSDFGLGASIWTKDRAKGDRMSRRIESGMVWINDHSFSHGACQCAWGGVKDSGLGRSHSKFGFYECVNVKQLAWEPGWTRDMWWQPYDQRPGHGDQQVGADPLRPQRQAPRRAARGARAAAARHPQDAPKRQVASADNGRPRLKAVRSVSSQGRDLAGRRHPLSDRRRQRR